jgi:hypothetical protein
MASSSSLGFCCAALWTDTALGTFENRFSQGPLHAPVAIPSSTGIHSPAHQSGARHAPHYLDARLWLHFAQASHRCHLPLQVRPYRLSLFSRTLADGRPRPDILYDPQKDYALSALDAYESYRRHVSTSHTTSADESRSPTRGGLRLHRNALMEGKGMLSWCMNESDAAASVVVGRVVDDELEVWVELTEVRSGCGASSFKEFLF